MAYSYYKTKELMRKLRKKVCARSRLEKYYKLKQEESELNSILSSSRRRVTTTVLTDLPIEAQVPREYVEDVLYKRKYNTQYAEYFMEMAKEYDNNYYNVIGSRINSCGVNWFFDEYRLQQVRDFKSVYLCKNKFCSNCQHLLQASRLKKYTPLLEELTKTYDLYHVVLTVPNVAGCVVNTTVTSMLGGYRKLIRYFSGNSCIAGLDFAKYGFIGSIRSLECTVEGDSFHPHLHCIFVLRKNMDLRKHNVNKFSYNSSGQCVRYFSDFEILLQKLWFCVMNKRKVTKSYLEDLPEGYSCIVDKCEDREYTEVFKYVTKLTKDNDNSAILNYDQFKILYNALYKRRILQGTGIFYGIKDDDEIDDEICDQYYDIITQLRNVEDPVQLISRIDELIKDMYTNQNLRIISRKSIQDFLSSELNCSKEGGEEEDTNHFAKGMFYEVKWVICGVFLITMAFS